MSREPIVVVGSTNTDLTVVCSHLPAPGETVLGGELVTAAGGKGANQAVAAARAGARVSLVAAVGDDDFGSHALARLRDEGINTEHVNVLDETASGVALIFVDQEGENMISVASGANARLSPGHVQAAAGAIAAAHMVLVQLEIPGETVAETLRIASEVGTPVLLNPAPAPGEGVPAQWLEQIAYLTPNRGEAAALAGMEAQSAPEALARALMSRGVGSVIMTLGADGACTCEPGACHRVAAPTVQAVDTVGAGDCFSGVLAVALTEGRSLQTATQYAAAAAALAVQRKGAQPAMPRRAEIDDMFNTHYGE
jgi:ribokinase